MQGGGGEEIGRQPVDISKVSEPAQQVHVSQERLEADDSTLPSSRHLVGYACNDLTEIR